MEKVTVKRISGEEISHRDFSYKGSDITFTTEAKGKGVAETVIPKRNVPEARAWIDLVNGVEARGTFLYGSGKWDTVYQANYWRRINRFSLGGGIAAGREHVGVSLGVMLWF